MDRTWVYRQFDNPEIVEMFGGDARGLGSGIRHAHRLGRVMMGIIRRAADSARLGFAVMLAPSAEMPWWELALAIPERSDRNAFAMMHALDIMAHYMLDHLHHVAAGARIRADNGASQAVVRRMGYVQYCTRFVDGHQHLFFSLDQARWAQRKARLERGEASYGSGLGAAFLTLKGPPYVPVPTDL
jgi:hypothetical protein